MHRMLLDIDVMDAYERDEQEEALNIIVLEKAGPEEVTANTVSAMNKCQTVNAKRLCVYDLVFKLQHAGKYDIGGTYTGPESDMWFYYTTAASAGHNYLLNLFICFRKIGNFALGVSDSNNCSSKQKEGDCKVISLPKDLTWQMFAASHPDEHFFVKTFCFNATNMNEFANTCLMIQVSIKENSMNICSNDMVKRIKIDHDLSELLSKQEKTDFFLESVSGKRFPVHKFILVAHSSVLRNIIKNIKENSQFIDISDNDMDLLLEFIYTGTIKDILKQDCRKLLEIADRFQLSNLFKLTHYALKEQIDVNNAVDVAIIAEKYGLEELQTSVFQFIQSNPEVLDTDGWKNLNDVNITKKLFQFMHNNKRKD